MSSLPAFRVSSNGSICSGGRNKAPGTSPPRYAASKLDMRASRAWTMDSSGTLTPMYHWGATTLSSSYANLPKCLRWVSQAPLFARAAGSAMTIASQTSSMYRGPANWVIGDVPRIFVLQMVSFNRRYRRHGHLFQNRYKSILCQEDPYLSERVMLLGDTRTRDERGRDIKEIKHCLLDGKRIGYQGPANRRRAGIEVFG